MNRYVNHLKGHRPLPQETFDIPGGAGHQLGGIVGLNGEMFPIIQKNLQEENVEHYSASGAHNIKI